MTLSRVDPDGALRDRLAAARAFQVPPDNMEQIDTPNPVIIEQLRDEAQRAVDYFNHLIENWDIKGDS